MSEMASQITNLTMINSIVYSGTDKRKTSKLRVTGLCEGNSPVTGEFPAQRASNAENASIWWRHHIKIIPALTRGWSPCKSHTTSSFPTNGWFVYKFDVPIMHAITGYIPTYPKRTEVKKLRISKQHRIVIDGIIIVTPLNTHCT